MPVMMSCDGPDCSIRHGGHAQLVPYDAYQKQFCSDECRADDTTRGVRCDHKRGICRVRCGCHGVYETECPGGGW